MTLEISGRVVTRENSSYEEARTMWNRAIEKYPLAIAFCKSLEDVAKSIKWAKAQGVPVRIRSGRHHYEGYSTGNDVLVIDVSEMNQIHLDEARGEVTIEGGVRNRELYEAVCSKGYPFPGGGCPTVGVVGFALGGGWGYSARLLGLGCDAITQIELINAEGEVVVASKEQNADLFWALKGSGGGQFGVVVKMTFKLPKKREEATLIRIESHHVTRKGQIEVFKLWQETIGDLCPEANFKLSFYNSKEKGDGILLIGIHYGTREEAHRLAAPFIQLGHTLQVLVQTMSVLEINRWIQDAHPEYEHYKSSGRFVKQNLEEQHMHEFLDMIKERAEGAVYTALSCYGLGGHIKSVKEDTTSFAYRRCQYILGFQTVWEDNKDSNPNKNWFVERFKVIETMTQGSFVNFPGAEITNYLDAYYGKNQDELIKIRKKYDKNNFFKFEQGL